MKTERALNGSVLSPSGEKEAQKEGSRSSAGT